MKKELSEILEKQGYKNFGRNLIIAVAIILIAGVLFLTYNIVYNKSCEDSNCFADALNNCKRVSWIRDDSQSTWVYKILGSQSDKCVVEVKLLKIKEGTLDIEKLQGQKMTCKIQKGSTEFPEKDVSKCSGLLKENIQDILIQRMHNYLLQNVGEIKDNFRGF